MRVTDNWTRLVWYKVGFKGFMAKVGRAVQSNDQLGLSSFDLLQVKEVRAVGGVTDPLSGRFEHDVKKTGRYVAFIGIINSLYIEVASRAECEWVVKGFNILLFGTTGRARSFKYFRSLKSKQVPVNGIAIHLFELFNKDGGRSLDEEEVTRALVWVGYAKRDEQVKKILENVPVPRDKGYDLDTFSTIVVACEHGELVPKSIREWDTLDNDSKKPTEGPEQTARAPPPRKRRPEAGGR